MKFLKSPLSTRGVRVPLLAAIGALTLVSALVTTAAASPRAATDWFVGSAVGASAQGTPIQIDPKDVTVRADGAIGLGYIYRARGFASGQLPGSFDYDEHGYLFFKNPTDPTSMVGSRFVSGVFTLKPASGSPTVRIADTAPEAYTSGVQTVVQKLSPQMRASLSALLGMTGPLTYGYFTFTNSEGTYTGYATPDFKSFAIRIKFELP